MLLQNRSWEGSHRLGAPASSQVWRILQPAQVGCYLLFGASLVFCKFIILLPIANPPIHRHIERRNLFTPSHHVIRTHFSRWRLVKIMSTYLFALSIIKFNAQITLWSTQI